MIKSGADASKSEPVRMGVCVGNTSFGGIANSGLDGNRDFGQFLITVGNSGFYNHNNLSDPNLTPKYQV